MRDISASFRASTFMSLPCCFHPPKAPSIVLSVPCQNAIVENDAYENELEHNYKDETGFVPDGPQVHIVHHLPRRSRKPTSLLDLDLKGRRGEIYNGIGDSVRKIKRASTFPF